MEPRTCKYEIIYFLLKNYRRILCGGEGKKKIPKTSENYFSYYGGLNTHNTLKKIEYLYFFFFGIRINVVVNKRVSEFVRVIFKRKNGRPRT